MYSITRKLFLPDYLAGARELAESGSTSFDTERNDVWEILVNPGRKALPGQEIEFSENFSCTVIDKTEFGGRLVKFHYSGDFDNWLDQLGEMPTPPYIHKKLENKDEYQTVYAKFKGSAAAPTAGLHFTSELLGK